MSSEKKPNVLEDDPDGFQANQERYQDKHHNQRTSDLLEDTKSEEDLNIGLTKTNNLA